MKSFSAAQDTLQAKKELLLKMLSSIERAAGFVAKGDMGRFEKEMRTCADIMRSVDELETIIKTSDTDGQSNSVKAETDSILRHVDEAVRKCAEEAEKQLGEIAGQIKQLRQTKRGMSGYSQRASGSGAVFVDAQR